MQEKISKEGIKGNPGSLLEESGRADRQSVKKSNKVFVEKHQTVKQKKGRISENYWGIRIPTHCHPKDTYLNDKCLLSCIVLGHLQNCLIESGDNRFTVAKNISLKEKSKYIGAFNILKTTVGLFESYLKDESVLDFKSLASVAPVAHKVFKVQLIIISGINYQIQYIYPLHFDESLRPVFLFDANENSNQMVL